MELHCEIALWDCSCCIVGRIVQFALCGFDPTHSILLHHADSIVRIPSCGFRHVDPIVQIPSCRFHRADSIVELRCEIALCKLHRAYLVVRIPSYLIVRIPSSGFYQADSIVRIVWSDSIVRIPSCKLSCRFYRADSIVRIVFV